PRQIRIGVVGGPVVSKVPGGHLIVTAVVLPPKRCFRTGVPILLAHAMEKCGEENTVPVGTQREAVLVTGLGIADDGHVAGISDRLLTSGIHIVGSYISVSDYESTG